MVISDEIKEKILFCKRCGLCREAINRQRGIEAVCPIRDVTTGFESSFARGKILMAAFLVKGLYKPDKKFANRFYECTLCGNCNAVCPNYLPKATYSEKYCDPLEIMQAVRIELVNMGLAPVGSHKRNVENLKNTRNPYGEKHEERNVGIPQRKEADYLLFAGCTPNYRTKEILEATLTILNRAGISYTVMDYEWCCGSWIKRVGLSNIYKEFKNHNMEEFETFGGKILTPCAGCYSTISKEYGLDTIHITELIAELIDEKKLKLKKYPKKITYHDPCHIGRLSNEIYEPPRKILQEIAHDNFLELYPNRGYSICCGAGGGLRAYDQKLANDIAIRKIRKAEEIADTLSSACPFCKLNFKEATQKTSSKTEVKDLTEIVAGLLK